MSSPRPNGVLTPGDEPVVTLAPEPPSGHNGHNGHPITRVPAPSTP
jgi:hypothetical protein